MICIRIQDNQAKSNYLPQILNIAHVIGVNISISISISLIYIYQFQ